MYRQTTDEFIRCLENAFWHFGGVPQTLVLDNLRAAVSKADWFDPEINPKVQSFCEHYGIVPLPTKPRMPRHKGKVERGIGYVQDNGLKGRRFTSLEAENAQCPADPAIRPATGPKCLNRVNLRHLQQIRHARLLRPDMGRNTA